jgi:hypothetical protein
VLVAQSLHHDSRQRVAVDVDLEHACRHRVVDTGEHPGESTGPIRSRLPTVSQEGARVLDVLVGRPQEEPRDVGIARPLLEDGLGVV